MDFNEEFLLNFMVSSHKKNAIEGNYVHLKRCLKKNDALCPSEMMVLTETRRTLTIFIPSTCA